MQGGGQEMVVMNNSKKFNNNNLGEFGVKSWEKATQIHLNCR